MDEGNLRDFRRELDALATLRDELRLKAHLARAELKDQLGKLEHKWEAAETAYARAKAHVETDVATLKREISVLLVDLKRGFGDIKRDVDAD